MPDIDECDTGLNDCASFNSICRNSNGSYDCGSKPDIDPITPGIQVL